MTNLKEVNFGLNQYCGPAVLSALTGRSTDECAHIIQSITGQTNIKGVFTKDMIKALDKLKFDAVPVKAMAFSLFGVISSLSKQEGIYIIVVPKHFVAVEVTKDKVYLVDNASKQPFDASASARLSQRVSEVLKVTARPQPVFLRTEIQIERTGRFLSVTRTKVYQDEKDNIVNSLGSLYAESSQELDELIQKIKEMK